MVDSERTHDNRRLPTPPGCDIPAHYESLRRAIHSLDSGMRNDRDNHRLIQESR